MDTKVLVDDVECNGPPVLIRCGLVAARVRVILSLLLDATRSYDMSVGQLQL